MQRPTPPAIGAAPPPPLPPPQHATAATSSGAALLAEAAGRPQGPSAAAVAAARTRHLPWLPWRHAIRHAVHVPRVHAAQRVHAPPPIPPPVRGAPRPSSNARRIMHDRGRPRSWHLACVATCCSYVGSRNNCTAPTQGPLCCTRRSIWRTALPAWRRTGSNTCATTRRSCAPSRTAACRTPQPAMRMRQSPAAASSCLPASTAAPRQMQQLF